ncbi:MAG TPA: tetratricopeptide repeat protein [Candidatus Mcinerneyibacteriales bacterium]|jgi:Flp pilus assembly protein TadD|nr:tetratricopeptide repeat protein [Candidatus Mcinerneyibacteriales bacterium]HPJ70211.1 tetratricopeptide repeat protein [Candidatus Mcinerneyibacteriales bacterium]HPQ88724.1 tetratricopeptide repeat protein [Candidatus Mcinerneyibacteriales bacterium]
MRLWYKIFVLALFINFTACVSGPGVRREVTGEDARSYIAFIEEKETGHDLNRMEEMIRALLKKYPQSTQLGNDLLAIQIEKEEYEAALKTTSFLLKITPDDVQTLYIKASLLELLGRSPLKVYEKLHELDPGNEYFLLKMEELYSLKGETDKILEVTKKLMADFPRKEAYLSKALFLLYKAEAWEEMLSLEGLYPGEKESFHDRIIEIFAIGKDVKNLSRFIRAVSPRLDKTEKARFYFALFYLAPEDERFETDSEPFFRQAEFSFYLGAYLMENNDAGDDTKAVPLFQRIPPRSPYYEESLVYLMKGALQEEDITALKRYYGLLRQKEGSGSIELSLLYYTLTEKSSLTEDLYSLLDFSRIEPRALAGFIDLLVQKGLIEEARQYGEKVGKYFTTKEGLFQYNFAMMRLFARTEEASRMRDHFQKASYEEEKNPDLMNYYAFSLLVIDPSFHEEALPLLEEAHALDPESPAIMDSLGWALVLSGDLEKGEAMIDRALEALPQDSEILFHKAMILKIKGRYQEALDILMDVKSNNGGDVIYYEDLDSEMDLLRSLIKPER